MRLFATLAAVVSAQAFFDETLLRNRRDEVGDVDACDGEGEVEVDGFCTSDPDVIAALEEANAEEDEEAAGNPLARRFSINGPSESNSDQESRTKERSQRITLLLTKVQLGNSLVDKNGDRIRPKQFMRMVNEYGCHCWPNDAKKQLSGQGKPIDAVDTSCFNLKQCHKCIDIDWPETCDPVTMKYKARLNKDDAGNMIITCANTLNKKKTNNGDCKKSLCECDREFAEQFSVAFETWNESNWKLLNSGSYEEYCTRQPSAERGMSAGADSCCGDYPNVKPYNSMVHTCEDGIVVV